MYSSRAERIVAISFCIALMRFRVADAWRKSWRLTRACLSGNPFKENGEALDRTGLKQVLQAEVIRFAFRAA